MWLDLKLINVLSLIMTPWNGNAVANAKVNIFS